MCKVSCPSRTHHDAVEDLLNGRVLVALEPLPARAVGGFEAPRPAGLSVGGQKVFEGVQRGRLPWHCEVGDERGPVGDCDEHAVHPPPPYEHLQREQERVGGISS